MANQQSKVVNGGRPSARRQDIVQIAAAMFAEKGFVGTTIRDIAQEANILSGSLYHHFKSKESIADEIIATYWADLLQSYDLAMSEETDAPARLARLIRDSDMVLERHAMGIRLLLNDWHYLVEFLPYLEDNMSKIEAIWTGVLKQGVKEGAFRRDLNPTLVYRTIMSSISGTGRWYRPGGKITISSISDTMVELFLSGLKVPSD